MKRLTREELAHGRALLEAAFEGTWTYQRFEIECSVCREGLGGDSECTHPDCDGSHVPATFVEAPECYPASKEHPDHESPQVVATIEVPGIETLAAKNGECICWMHNNGPALMAAYAELLEIDEALAWLCMRGQPLPPLEAAQSVIDYAKSLGWQRDGSKP